MANEPLAGKRMTKVTERKRKPDWAEFIQELATRCEEADEITLVLDNLRTHKPVRPSLLKKPNAHATG
jgi:hypothetical protein